MALGVRIKGAENLRANLGRLATLYPKAALGALYQEGQELLRQSKPFVPVDTGTLRSSGFVTRPVGEGSTQRVTVGYGGAAASYAAAVHERFLSPSGKFIVHEVGQAKYLQVAFDAYVPNYLQRIRDRIVRSVGRLGPKRGK